MPAALVHNAYGKSQVRLTKVQRRPDRHDVIDWSIDVRLEGDFSAAFTDGDNRQVVATDTMKNIVYALARDHDLATPETFGLILGRHFLDSYPQVTSADLTLTVQPWQRVEAAGRPLRHAFVAGPPGRQWRLVAQTRKSAQVTAGIERLPLLKTAHSAFRGFYRDHFTTLPEVDDRIMATDLTAEWLYAGVDVNWDESYATVYQALVETFARHRSLGVQQTLYAMGEAALAACPAMTEITLTMPNRHRILVDLSRFERDNPNEVFVTTDDPFGMITGTLRRSD